MFATLAVALVAVGLAIGCWLRPLPTTKSSSTPSYTDQQIADAKASTCGAFAKVDHALDVVNTQQRGGDPTSILAVATSLRQVLDAGSRYLLSKLAEEPATPADIADEIRKYADSSQELVMGYLDGLTNSDAEMKPSLQAGDEATVSIRRLCK